MDIGNAAKSSGLSAKMIRYYESIGLLPAATRTDSGYRIYNATDLHTLAFIKRSWQDRGRAGADVKALARQHISEPNQKIEEFAALRDTLQNLVEHCHGDRRPDCPILLDLASSQDFFGVKKRH